MKYLSKILPYAEKLFLALLLVGAVLKAMDMAGMIFIALGLTGLANVFFLGAYVPSNVSIAEDEKAGFNELLVLAIIPKVLGISMAVATIGIMFYLTGLEGHEHMTMIGTLAIIISIIIVIVLKVINVSYVESLFPKILKSLIIVIAVIGIWYDTGLF